MGCEEKEERLCWFERWVRAGPWWLLAAQALALAPGYFYWLITADGAGAKEVLKVGVLVFLVFIMAFGGGVFFSMPLDRPDRCSRLERAGYAAGGGALWAAGTVVVAAELLGLGLLAAARVATPVFFAAWAFGFWLVGRKAAASCRAEKR